MKSQILSTQTKKHQKLRYEQNKNNRTKFYEFNCFDDKDLNVPVFFQQKVQQISVDDDCETDDETRDHYVKMCFIDLVLGIQEQYEEDKQKDVEEYLKYFPEARDVCEF
ncbi:hypothetical protein IMG5_168270 [Ichthyophthirius multifiliis]|uniref:Uncharacterized protein n=1 Tax=Ichthyophthirius multifiliis TaxID=5932 RepID=G0R124_ICHMU|nr:hypothetical protein IMG5_168270 [Ichthyophthirius multifiliis]EGR28791.1 hypothetical protein IMG5_168270 [Ichthyophthirius multifiliis]|eukprot:XP_004030027.1 hypothetical protein IMG5_168270 [Ichthyophthirius multifiliis]